MRVLHITRYESFVSFVVEAQAGQVHVQYRAEDVWRDNSGVWQIAEGARPYHVAVLVPAAQERDRLSPILLAALSRDAG